MSSGDNDRELASLYRDVAREKSPAWLDANILQAAARRARRPKIHKRLRLLAMAAVFFGLLIAAPQWQSIQQQRSTESNRHSIDTHSALANSLRNLAVTPASTSVVGSCLRRTDLCSKNPTSRR